MPFGICIAKAIWQMVWLPKYGYGSVSIVPRKSSGVGDAGVLMNGKPIPLNSSVALWQQINKGYMRVIIGANSLFARNFEFFKYMSRLTYIAPVYILAFV